MKNFMKKISLVLAIVLLISSLSFTAFATELDSDKLSSDIDFMNLVTQFVRGRYQYEIKDEDVVNGIFEGIFKELDNNNIKYSKEDYELYKGGLTYDLSKDFNYFKNLVSFIYTDYPNDISQDKIMEAMYDGFFDKLDVYSVYYTPEEYNAFSTNLSGEFVGIGVQIISRDGYIVVSSPLPNTPAEQAGIKTDDKIISVDDKDITGFTTDQAAQLIKGPSGTTVKIGVLRGKEKLTFNIKRGNIVVSSISTDILENNLGYLKISSFNDNTDDLVEEALANFDAQNIKKIIIDIRDNPGGSLSTVVNILENFVPQGPVLYVDYQGKSEDVYESDLKQTKYDICVLVNNNSASASEIMAGAIQDRKVGKIIGTTTYGKGVVQSLYSWGNGIAVKFTTAEYFTPNRHQVHGKGITPDIKVENTLGEPKVDITTYPTLDKIRKPNIGVEGNDVLGAEMILKTLGYAVNEPDGKLDEVTFSQIKKFQKDMNLYPYGVLDFTTQDALTLALKQYAQPPVIDKQLEKAIQIMSK